MNTVIIVVFLKSLPKNLELFVVVVEVQFLFSATGGAAGAWCLAPVFRVCLIPSMSALNERSGTRSLSTGDIPLPSAGSNPTADEGPGRRAGVVGIVSSWVGVLRAWHQMSTFDSLPRNDSGQFEAIVKGKSGWFSVKPQ